MDYKKLVSVTGLSGLFELLSSKSDGAVLKSLEDNSTKFVSTRQHNFSHLDSIEIYTVKDNITLSVLFEAMKKSKEKLPEAKADNASLKTYFEKVYPELDFERVYASDMKKMVKWFEIIKKNKIDFISGDTPEITNDNLKPSHKEVPTVKDMKPQKIAPRKIESRGVK